MLNINLHHPRPTLSSFLLILDLVIGVLILASELLNIIQLGLGSPSSLSVLLLFLPLDTCVC